MGGRRYDRIPTEVGRLRAAVEPQPFEPGSHAELAGLPAGRFHKAHLATGDDEGLTTHLPPTGVPVLTYLVRDLAAGRRGNT